MTLLRVIVTAPGWLYLGLALSLVDRKTLRLLRDFLDNHDKWVRLP